MRGFPSPSAPDAVAALRVAATAGAVAFAAECRAISAMFDSAAPEDQEFVSGEVGCALHLAPATAMARVCTALSMTARPQLLGAVEHGRLGVGQALAVLGEIEHLDAEHAEAVLTELFGPNDPLLPDADPQVRPEVALTAGELRAAARKAVIAKDPKAARARHQRAKKTAGVRGRPGFDGMGQIVIDCTAVQMATGLAAISGRAAAMTFEDPELTEGQKRVAAFLHALGCDRTGVQAVIECPVEKAVDLHALAHAPVWTVGVRMPAAVALGLSDHPAVLTGYGPIDADQARALLPAADLIRACVDSDTGEVLSVDAPVRAKTWATTATAGQAATGRDAGRRDTAGQDSAGQDTGPDADGCPATDRARLLRQVLTAMATSGATLVDLSCPGYVPSEALGRLVDVRDVTSVFPGDSNPARRCDRDHRLPYPLGATADWNLQNTSRRWHRAKHTNWTTQLLPDGTIRWTSPAGHHYDRRPKRTPPPKIGDHTNLPPIGEDPGG